MSVDLIRSIFAGAGRYDVWSLQLVKVNNNKEEGTSYLIRELPFKPDGSIKAFLEEVAERYLNDNKGVLNKYQDVREYDGTSLANTIYYLDKDSDLIKKQYAALIAAIASPDAEIDPLNMGTQAYLINGRISISDEQHSVKFISMQKPVTNLNHKFWYTGGAFRKIGDKVISLRTSINVIIYDDRVFMLTLDGENLFNMERDYKATCCTKYRRS